MVGLRRTQKFIFSVPGSQSDGNYYKVGGGGVILTLLRSPLENSMSCIQIPFSGDQSVDLSGLGTKSIRAPIQEHSRASLVLARFVL